MDTKQVELRLLELVKSAMAFPVYAVTRRIATFCYAAGYRDAVIDILEDKNQDMWVTGEASERFHGLRLDVLGNIRSPSTRQIVEEVTGYTVLKDNE